MLYSLVFTLYFALHSSLYSVIDPLDLTLYFAVCFSLCSVIYPLDFALYFSLRWLESLTSLWPPVFALRQPGSIWLRSGFRPSRRDGQVLSPRSGRFMAFYTEMWSLCPHAGSSWLAEHQARELPNLLTYCSLCIINIALFPGVLLLIWMSFPYLPSNWLHFYWKNCTSLSQMSGALWLSPLA